MAPRADENLGYAPYAKERFETARQHSILHLEGIVRQSGSDPEECRGRARIAAAKQVETSY
jgi:hypothetical protein